jgi:hypothetical protein
MSIEKLPPEIMQYSNVFVTDSLSCLPPHRKGYDFEINLRPNSKPPFKGMYHLSKQESLQLKQYVFDLKAKGFIRDSLSPAGAPIFFVKTPGKANRPCVDYCHLISMTVRDSYLLPVIANLLNSLSGYRFLSKINLKAAFNLLRVAPGHEWKTAFRTPWGLFEY